MARAGGSGMIIGVTIGTLQVGFAAQPEEAPTVRPNIALVCHLWSSWCHPQTWPSASGGVLLGRDVLSPTRWHYMAISSSLDTETTNTASTRPPGAGVLQLGRQVRTQPRLQEALGQGNAST